MNKLTRACAVALGLALLSPAIALADDPAQAGPPQGGPPPAVRAQFAQMHEKMDALHTQSRTEILSALTPAHKAAVANIIGQLAVAPNPNPEAAAHQLDALLSSGERSSILRIHESMRTQMRSLMESMHSQMQQAMQQSGAPAGPPRGMHEGFGGGQHAAPDAGHILLMLGAFHGPHPMMMHG
jgi:uncharacterized membrane protein YdfJ with MMPL/SSD domain